MSRLISISGHPGAGKDTVFNLISSELVGKAVIQKLKFAYGIQDIVCKLAGIYSDDFRHRELFENREWKEFYPLFPTTYKFQTPRKAAQTIGQGMRDIVGDSIWIDTLDKERKNSDADYLIITDARYENEINYIRTTGGFIIFVDRPEAEFTAKGNSVFNHPSEQYVDEIKERADLVLDNSGTYEDLIVTVSNNLLRIQG